MLLGCVCLPERGTLPLLHRFNRRVDLVKLTIIHFDQLLFAAGEARHDVCRADRAERFTTGTGLMPEMLLNAAKSQAQGHDIGVGHWQLTDIFYEISPPLTH